MSKGLLQLIWGLIIFSFHINLGPVPILPPFVGAILMAVGISNMKQEFESKALGIAKGIAVGLSVYTILSTIDGILGFTGELFSHSVWHYRFILATGAILMVAEALCFFFVLLAGTEYLNRHEFHGSAQTQKTNQWVYLVLMGAGAIATAIGINLSTEYSIYCAIAILLVRIYCLIVLGSFRANVKLCQLPSGESMPEQAPAGGAKEPDSPSIEQA